MVASSSFIVIDNKNPQKGPLSDGDYSNDKTPTLNITLPDHAQIGDTLTLTDGTTRILTRHDIHTGTLKITYSPLSDGPHTLGFTVAHSGQAPYFTSESFVDHIDTQKPVISDILVAGGTTLDESEDINGFDVTGHVSGDLGALLGQEITVSIYHHNTLIATETGHVDANGSWFATFDPNLPIPKGKGYSVHATVADKAGNHATDRQGFDSIACFMAGTLVQCPTGAVSVETLKIGDPVVTSDGRVAPVRWIGRQTVSLLFADRLRVLPIRIKAGAIAERLPTRDLRLSPDHAILVDDVLIQAGALVNGTSIVREENVPQNFVYYHVELADHALILAENTPAETFIDNVDRLAFDNWAEHEALYGDGASLTELTYPRAKAHRQVPQAIRQRLAARGTAMSAPRSDAA